MSDPQAPRTEDERLAEALASMPPDPVWVRVGNGDDGAALASEGDVVVAKDLLVDGVHFELGSCSPQEAAYKALAVNLSDLAAMGAEARGFLVGGVLPAAADPDLFAALMRGFAEAARAFDVPCLGGDTNVAAGPLVLSVTVLGRPMGARLLRRRGARAGDILSVTGPLGGSLVAGRHLKPRPRFDVARLASAGTWVHAMMDLSDGLLRDLPRLLGASGVGAVVHAADIPVHADVADAPAPGDGVLAPAVRAALSDGEDFELLLAHEVPSTEVRASLTKAGIELFAIGEVVPASRGLVLQDGHEVRAWPDGGFDHFARHA